MATAGLAVSDDGYCCMTYVGSPEHQACGFAMGLARSQTGLATYSGTWWA